MNKPFSLIEEEVTLNIVRTADVLLQRTIDLLKPFDLSPSQYNVLRILRGANGPLACGQIAERMVSRDPDITRLLDRMEAREFIHRVRDAQDRRVVKAQITGKGSHLLQQLDPLVAAHHQKQFVAVGQKKLRRLVDDLQQIRESVSQAQRAHPCRQ